MFNRSDGGSIEENEKLAGEVMSLPFITSALLFPVIGLVIDKFGKRINLLIYSAFFVVLS